MWLNAKIPNSDASDQKLGGNVTKIMQNTWRIFPFDKWMQILEQVQNMISTLENNQGEKWRN